MTQGILKVEFPNVRKLFLPDRGKTLVDCDLSGADAQVVAWEAEDDELKRAFKEGLNVHNHNGVAMWGDSYIPDRVVRPPNVTMRDDVKRGVHAVNYGTSARTLAQNLSWSVAQAEAFKARWLSVHPAIEAWHGRVYYNLQTTRTVSNRFGYRIMYFDRPDSLLPKALAWGPQSTVAILASRGGVALQKYFPFIDILLQVHDSVVFQLPNHHFNPNTLLKIKETLRIPVPYPDPLYIPWGIKASQRSWGHCRKCSWEGEFEKEAA
jgi:DNA polymerase-1